MICGGINREMLRCHGIALHFLFLMKIRQEGRGKTANWLEKKMERDQHLEIMIASKAQM